MNRAPVDLDAAMRKRARAILDGVDVASVRVIDDEEAARLAFLGQAEGDLSLDELRALALWAAKGGLVRA